MDYNAKLKSAYLVIYVKLPEALLDKVKAEANAAREALADHPNFIIKLMRVSDSKDVAEFTDNIDVEPIRAELQRKCKKLGMPSPSGKFPVNYSVVGDHIEFTYWARG